MAEQCNAVFDGIAQSLGDFTCQNAPAVVHLRNPFALSNWTLPVLESDDGRRRRVGVGVGDSPAAP